MPTIKLVAGIGMAASSLLAAAVPASGALTYVSGDFANIAAAGQSDVPEAPCPDDTSILGGGIYSSGGYGTSAINSSILGDLSWEGSIDVYQPPVTIRAHAICDSKRPTYPNKAKTAAAGDRSKIKKGCPSGKHVQSGGFVSNGAFLAARATASRPFDGGDANKERDDGWEATFDTNIGQTPTIAVLAICSKKPTLVKQRTTMADPEAQSGAVKPCGPGRVVIGGGAKLAVPYNEGFLNSLFPVDGADVNPDRDDSFRVYADNIMAEPRKLTVYTICR